MSNSDRARKLLVRTFLVTGSTVATIMGAQGLITLDQQTLIGATSDATATDSTTATITRAAPEITIASAAPSIVILPDDEETPPQVVASAPTVQLQQSVPVQPQITAPQPQMNTQQLTLQQLLSMRSRSTR